MITNKLECTITALYQTGVRYYGAGGALGFDTLAAQAVLRLRESCHGMKLILVLPCLTQTKGWRPEDVVEYKRIKAQADKSVFVVISEKDLRMGRGEIAAYLEACGIAYTEEDIRLLEVTAEGNAYVLHHVALRMKEGLSPGPELYAEMRHSIGRPAMGMEGGTVISYEAVCQPPSESAFGAIS